jgi:hypothetical protein
MHIGEEERGRWKDRTGPAINDMPNKVYDPSGESCPWDKMNRHVSQRSKGTREALNVHSVGFRHINSHLIYTRTKLHSGERHVLSDPCYIFMCITQKQLDPS